MDSGNLVGCLASVPNTCCDFVPCVTLDTEKLVETVPSPLEASCCSTVYRAAVLMYTELLVTSAECHTLIQTSGYKGVGCCSVASC